MDKRALSLLLRLFLRSTIVLPTTTKERHPHFFIVDLGLGNILNMFLLVTRQERPWFICAVFLLFVLVTLYDEKNVPRAPRVAQTINKEVPPMRPLLGHDDEDENDDGDTAPAGTTIDYDALPAVPSTDFHFCTAPYVYLTDTNRTIEIPYQCDGRLYRAFIGRLRTFCDDLVTTGEQSPMWGHRQSLPPGRRYLVLGNSHTRQTAMALLCQFKVHDSESLETKNKAMARRYDLDDGTQVYLVVNSYVVHSPKWVELLEQQIGVKLTDFDAVVLGVFNTCNAEVNTTFATDMKAMEDEQEGVDCLNHEGPSLKQVAAAYPGPMVYVSMFATYRFKTYSQDRDDAKVITQQGRSNLMYLDGRQYLSMYALEECGSPKRDDLVDCVHGEEARRYHHRCVGRYGGHPDLIAWDVIEFLYKHTA